ncbi:MAG: response regulator transcription factor [Nitrospira sp.]|nr:response regulator transcription factor [Nitrospira sp.]
MTPAARKRSSGPLRLYLVDAHPVARLGLRAFFDRYPSINVSGDATTLAAALQDLRRCKPDVLITDSFPIPKRVLGRLPTLRVLYTLESLAHCSLVRLLEDLTHGQAGFALKSLTLARLLKAVRQVAAGRRYRDPAFMRLVKAEQQPSQALSPKKQRRQPNLLQGQTKAQKRTTKRGTQRQRKK